MSRKPTGELVPGDVVSAHGLKVRINEVCKRELLAGGFEEDLREGLIQEGKEPFVYWSVGTVLNYREAIESGFPKGYLGKADGEFTWVIQGNARALWTVED
jgi:hypothetical protein